MQASETLWTGKDIQGNDYCVCVDRSPSDFWIKTTIKKDKFGNFTVISCEVIPTSKGKDDAS